MTDRRQTTTPDRVGISVRFLADESGASRLDRLFLMVGGGIVCVLVLFLWAADALDTSEEVAEAAPEAPVQPVTRTVSAGPLRAPDPPVVDGAGGSDIFVAYDYSELQEHGPDREAQILEDEVARIRAAEAAVAATAVPQEGEADAAGAASTADGS